MEATIEVLGRPGAAPRLQVRGQIRDGISEGPAFLEIPRVDKGLERRSRSSPRHHAIVRAERRSMKVTARTDPRENLASARIEHDGGRLRDAIALVALHVRAQPGGDLALEVGVDGGLDPVVLRMTREDMLAHMHRIARFEPRFGLARQDLDTFGERALEGALRERAAAVHARQDVTLNGERLGAVSRIRQPARRARERRQVRRLRPRQLPGAHAKVIARGGLDADASVPERRPVHVLGEDPLLGALALERQRERDLLELA